MTAKIKIHDLVEIPAMKSIGKKWRKDVWLIYCGTETAAAVMSSAEKLPIPDARIYDGLF